MDQILDQPTCVCFVFLFVLSLFLHPESESQCALLTRYAYGSGLQCSFFKDTENFSVARKLKLEADQLDAKANEMKQTAMWLRQLAKKFESAGINV